MWKGVGAAVGRGAGEVAAQGAAGVTACKGRAECLLRRWGRARVDRVCGSGCRRPQSSGLLHGLLVQQGAAARRPQTRSACPTPSHGRWPCSSVDALTAGLPSSLHAGCCPPPTARPGRRAGSPAEGRTPRWIGVGTCCRKNPRLERSGGGKLSGPETPKRGLRGRRWITERRALEGLGVRIRRTDLRTLGSAPGWTGDRVPGARLTLDRTWASGSQQKEK